MDWFWVSCTGPQGRRREGARSAYAATESGRVGKREEFHTLKFHYFQTVAPPICADASGAADDRASIPTARKITSLSAPINKGESPTAGIMRKVSMPCLFASSRASM